MITRCNPSISLGQFTEIFKSQISSNTQQKRILLIATLALACLAACYAVFSCFRRYEVTIDVGRCWSGFVSLVKQKVNASPDVKQNQDPQAVKAAPDVEQPGVEDSEEKQSEKAFLEAIELMSPDPQYGTKQQEDLKKAIAKILPQHINVITTYRDGVDDRQQTLLLQAIMFIEHDRAKCLEIVKLLLDKGADPTIEGFCYGCPVVPIKEAQELLKYTPSTENQQIVDLLLRRISELLIER
jgi:hypothetical protein